MDWLPPRVTGGRNIWMVLFDGGVDSHQGQGGSGFALVHHNTGRLVKWGFQYSGDFASNNIEEYRGMIAGLQAALEVRLRGDLLVVMGDSQLITKHMRGTCKVGWKLQHWFDIASGLAHHELVSYHWVRRELNTATDYLSKECRTLRHWQQPEQAASSDQWLLEVSSRMNSLNDIISIMGQTIEVPCFYVASFKDRVRRYHKETLDEMSLTHGHHKYYSMRPRKWIMSGSERAGVLTKHTGLEHHARWKGVAEEAKTPKIVTTKTCTDMGEIRREARRTTRALWSVGWNIAQLVRNIRDEPSCRPNTNLNPRLYDLHLQGYGDLALMKRIAESGVQVRMQDDFKAPRPWPGNFKIDRLALPLMHHDVASSYNLRKGMFLEMGPAGEYCPEMVISPVGGVQKGGFPIWEKVRIIQGLSTPLHESINANTANIAPDACFGVVGELADRILTLRWSEGPGDDPIPIMGMSGDIDAAFPQIPLSADSVKYFASRIPNTSILFLPFNLVFGWTGSPGYFAVYAKALRHLQRTHGSWIGCTWTNYWGFVWVDDVILIEPDIGQRLTESEWNIRQSVETVFGPKGWKREKFESWSSRWKSLGLVWNTQTCTVEMPCDKLANAAELLREVGSSDRARVKTLQSLLGRLRHIIVCVPAAKPFVQRIQKLVNTATWEGSEHVSNIRPCFPDLHFWNERLRTVDFTSWPLEFFGSTGTAAAIWTVGILDGSPCVHWDGKGITLAAKGHIRPGLAESLWLLLLAAIQWLPLIKEMNIRAPRILVLLGRADWADGFNKGNVWKMRGQEALRQLSDFQMRHRISFRGESWKKFGNKTPRGWSLIINAAHNDTNPCQIGRHRKDWIRMPCSWLCNRCVQRHIKNIRAGLTLGKNSQNVTASRFGFIPEATKNRQSCWFDTLPSWPQSKRISGAQLKERSAPCGICTAYINIVNSSRTVPSSPWWRRADVSNWTTLGHGSPCPSQ